MIPIPCMYSMLGILSIFQSFLGEWLGTARDRASWLLAGPQLLVLIWRSYNVQQEPHPRENKVAGGGHLSFLSLTIGRSLNGQVRNDVTPALSHLCCLDAIICLLSPGNVRVLLTVARRTIIKIHCPRKRTMFADLFLIMELEACGSPWQIFLQFSFKLSALLQGMINWS